ncbi:MAG: hypothetical protein FJ388_05200 [Verrucomicrobia bacterium]|nr:hypothetical protein [Verrucomicrobiota bacterium]
MSLPDKSSAEAVMKQFSRKRPTAVTVIGWLCIVGGSIAVLETIWNIRDSLPQPFLNLLAAAVFLLLGVVNLIAGVYLLRLRAWARTAIEVVCCVEIFVFSLGPILWGAYVIGFERLLAGWSAQAKTIMCASLALQCAVPAVVNGIIIYFLRSKKVRDAFANDVGQDK